MAHAAPSRAHAAEAQSLSGRLVHTLDGHVASAALRKASRASGRHLSAS